MSKIHQIFYVSNAAKTVSSATVDEILKVAREFNNSNNITGVLMFKGGIFLQLLEGDKDKVEALYKKIESDPRHENVIQLFTNDADERIYPDWSMGYRKLEELDVKFVNEILSWNKLIAASKDLDHHLILHLLERFKSRAQKS